MKYSNKNCKDCHKRILHIPSIGGEERIIRGDSREVWSRMASGLCERHQDERLMEMGEE